MFLFVSNERSYYEIVFFIAHYQLVSYLLHLDPTVFSYFIKLLIYFRKLFCKLKCRIQTYVLVVKEQETSDFLDFFDRRRFIQSPLKQVGSNASILNFMLYVAFLSSWLLLSPGWRLIDFVACVFAFICEVGSFIG